MTDRELDTRQLRRMRHEDKQIARLNRLEAKAEAMVGQLVHGGYYIYPPGGKYRTGTKIDLIQFLIRNGYVR